MNDDIFAVSDDEQSSGKPPAAEVARPKPLSIDLSGAKRKADLETEESVTDSQKRLRSTGACCTHGSVSKTIDIAKLASLLV